ncbi:class A beta-lactamase-related serine hydrolase [Hymenobacter sp. BT175]|uniref:serine hydrolase n=1 Tax=Hymenobacter translucens TaxID=2886507 RepID=UPI001D0E7DC4|nr:serine hydrolase [Hymenobacter translucens]MCC2547161.1 class A beta-lactamase-related serine hydrolase [Hymenobacter translucens]
MRASLLIRRLLPVSGLLALAFTAPAQPGNPLRRLLKADTTRFGRVLRQPDAYKVQILYTRIDRDAQNRPRFKSFSYRLRPSEYFYPASTVKLPAAALALEKLHQLKARHPALHPDSPLRIDSAFAGQTRVLRDTTSATGRGSIAHYIRKVLLVSDNDGFNRLYEFLGQRELNEGLARRGYRNFRLIHRLSVGDQEPGSRHTNPVTFFADTALQQPLYQQPAAFNEAPFPQLKLSGERVGEAYLKGDKRVNEPLDLSSKSYLGLREQQQLLRAILFPESLPAARRFDLGEEDYSFLRRYMSELPRESRFPKYPVGEYPDNYAKFLLAGGAAGPLPPGVRIFNKIGQAYGFLIDNAYIVDPANGVEFMLSAVIYTNSDGVLNDDHYDYDTIGFPFLRDLGRAVYDYELKRPRRHRPDLSRFQLSYDEPLKP